MLLDEAAYGELDILITSTSLKNIYCALTKYADELTAREFVDAALDAFTVVAVDDSICRMAARSNKPVFEDGIVRACAERMRVDFIISRDEKAFLHSPIKRLSARDYVDLFCDVKQAAF